MNRNDIKIEDLLDRPIWQLSGREFCALTQFATANLVSKTDTPRRNCKGIEALASELGCSPSKIYELRKLGILQGAEISHIGKAIIFDVEKAKELIKAHLK